MKERKESLKRTAVYMRARCDTRMQEIAMIHVQQDQCHELARRLGSKIDSEFVDLSVGVNEDRPGLQALLERLRQKPQIDYVLAADESRLTRGVANYITLDQKITKAGAIVMTPADDGSSPQQARFLRLVRAAMAELARQKRPDRAAEERRRKRNAAEPPRQLDSREQAT